MERAEWGRLKEPSLLLSNHPPLWEAVKLFKDVSRFSTEGNGVTVVMDASFLKLAEILFGFEGIPVDVQRNVYKTGDLGVYLRSMVIRTWGEKSGLYDEALGGMEVVDQMREVLESGRSVFVCPAGTGSTNARWRSGVGCLVKEIYEDERENDIGVGLIAAGKNKYVLLSFPSIAELFGRELVEGVPSAKVLAANMQKLSEGILMAS